MSDDSITGKEYVALVILLAGGLLAAALLVSWAYQQRGILAPSDSDSVNDGESP